MHVTTTFASPSTSPSASASASASASVSASAAASSAVSAPMLDFSFQSTTSSSLPTTPLSPSVNQLLLENAILRSHLQQVLHQYALPPVMFQRPLIQITPHSPSHPIRKQMEGLITRSKQAYSYPYSHAPQLISTNTQTDGSIISSTATDEKKRRNAGSIQYFESFAIDTSGSTLTTANGSLTLDHSLVDIPYYEPPVNVIPLSATTSHAATSSILISSFTRSFSVSPSPAPTPTLTPTLLTLRTLSEAVSALGRCFNCGESGHSVRDCSVPKDESCIRLNSSIYRQYGSEMTQLLRGDRDRERGKAGNGNTGGNGNGNGGEGNANLRYYERVIQDKEEEEEKNKTRENEDFIERLQSHSRRSQSSARSRSRSRSPIRPRDSPYRSSSRPHPTSRRSSRSRSPVRSDKESRERSRSRSRNRSIEREIGNDSDRKENKEKSKENGITRPSTSVVASSVSAVNGNEKTIIVLSDSEEGEITDDEKEVEQKGLPENSAPRPPSASSSSLQGSSATSIPATSTSSVAGQSDSIPLSSIDSSASPSRLLSDIRIIEDGVAERAALETKRMEQEQQTKLAQARSAAASIPLPSFFTPPPPHAYYGSSAYADWYHTQMQTQVQSQSQPQKFAPVYTSSHASPPRHSSPPTVPRTPISEPVADEEEDDVPYYTPTSVPPPAKCRVLSLANQPVSSSGYPIIFPASYPFR